jgi:hypothetical protein
MFSHEGGVSCPALSFQRMQIGDHMSFEWIKMDIAN